MSLVPQIFHIVDKSIVQTLSQIFYTIANILTNHIHVGDIRSVAYQRILPGIGEVGHVRHLAHHEAVGQVSKGSEQVFHVWTDCGLLEALTSRTPSIILGIGLICDVEGPFKCTNQKLRTVLRLVTFY
uniref:Uncharacterized protein n=1 Tax=Cacopsylla melanoneura TaxID=428564 RepID=A0A8D8QR47_9HEMI